jgi:hypothetical protein
MLFSQGKAPMHHRGVLFGRTGLEGGGVDLGRSVHFFGGRAAKRGRSQGLSFYRDQVAQRCKTDNSAYPHRRKRLLTMDDGPTEGGARNLPRQSLCTGSEGAGARIRQRHGRRNLGVDPVTSLLLASVENFYSWK